MVNQKSEVRVQGSGVRGQESGVRSQESAVRSQETIRNLQSAIRNLPPLTTHHSPLTIAAVLCLLALTAAAPAQDTVREIFVPFEDLNVILQSDAQRVFLTREDYEALLAKAASKPVVKVPLSATVVAAQYAARLEEGRALIEGKLQLDLLEDGLFTIPLDIGGVGIRSATLDGKAAPLSRNDQGQVVLFVQGGGKHELTLALTAPLATSAATQTLQATLPVTSATKLDLTVPGNVEVRAGAPVINRSYDEPANTTKLELLPHRGPMAVVMSLNNKQLQDQRVILASSVLVAEVTQGYERLHATVSHRVLHGAVDKLRFALPAGFEVTQVNSPLLARWEVKKDAMPAVLEAILREPTTEPIVLQVTATRSPPALEKWSFPRLVPLDVTGQVAVVGLLVEDRFDPQRVVPTGLIPVDADTLAAAIPQSVFQAEPGAPIVRQAVSFYAPSGDYSLAAEFARPPVELRVASSGLLTLAEKQQRYSGTVVLIPQAEDLYEFSLNVPAPWQVTEVAKADGTPLAFERYETPALAAAPATTRLIAKIPGGVKAGQQLAIRFQAVAAPAGWLADWESQAVAFPQFTMVGATRDSGPVGIKVEDDLSVRPQEAQGLVPLSDVERQSLTTEQLALAYRFDQRPFTLSLAAERIAPSLTAEVFAFLAIDADHLDATYELHYAVRDARTQRVEFSLPESTPAELNIQQIDPASPQARIKIKEATSRVADGRRFWTVQLAQRQTGNIWIEAKFQQRFDKAEPQDVRMPLAQAEGVDHQSVVVGIEGGSDLDIQVDKHPREVDVGELQGNVAYEVSRRLIGAFGYVGTENEANQVVVDVIRREQHPLPAAFVERVELVTRVSQSGRSQSVARYDLKTKATLIEVELPAGAALWTMYLDGQPTKPQKEDGRLLLTLPAQGEATKRTLQIVYETQQPPLGLSGNIEQVAPRVLLRVDPAKDSAIVPQVKLQWTLVLPSGYLIRRADGTVFSEALAPRELAAVKTVRWVWEVMNTPVSPFEYRQAAREMSSGNNLRGDIDASFLDTRAIPNTAASPSIVSGSESMTAEAMSAAREQSAESFRESADQAPEDPFARSPARGDKSEADEKRDLARDLAHEEGSRRQSMMKSQMGTNLATQPPVTEFAPERPADEPNQPPGEDPSGSGSGAKGAQVAERRWAEQGLASLVIDFQADRYAPQMTFKSLGVEPRISAVAVETRRADAAAWGLGMLVFLIGVGMTRQPARHKCAYIVLVMLAATVPLLVTRQLDEVAQVFDFLFYAAALLVPYYILAAIGLATWNWLTPRVMRWFESTPAVNPAATVSVLLVAIALAAGTSAQAQQPVDVKNLIDLLPMLDPGGPVSVPQDAIIIPYDSERPEGLREATKVLVPYDKYVELWNRANPDQRLNEKSPPAPFALAGASYQATLADGNELLIAGRIEIDVFTDKPVLVPLNLVGGVLAKATLDGQPARIQSVQPQPLAAGGSGAEAPAQQAANPAPNAAEIAKVVPPGSEAVMLLHTSGKGRKTLDLTIRLGLTRQGGWRISGGRLPAAPSTALTITVPQEQTEVRLSGLPDKGTFESTKANDQIETALADSGALSLSWRPKVTEGMVDRSLTAKSIAAIDVREDAIRVVWQLALDFGRSTRETLQFDVPLGYLVEQVTGENIRGFSVKEENGRQSLTVTLLKSAVGKETLAIHLSQRGVVGQGDLAQFAAPDVRVESAVLHQGDISIRRSTRLDLRAVTVADLSRADADGTTAAAEQLADASETSFIPLATFQTYRFVREGFKLTLAARPLAQETTAQVRAIVRAGERDTSLDAAITYHVVGEPLYRARIYLPDGFELDRLLPEGVEWAITEEEVDVDGAKVKRQLLTVHLQRGQTGDFQLALLGKLPPRAKPDEVVAPKLEILDVARQEGEMAFLPEPDTDIEVVSLSGCERISTMESLHWVQAEQRHLAKLGLRFRSQAYAATLKLTPRTPRITATTLTNVRITPKAIEETLVFRYQVLDAGVRELSVILPEYLRRARLPADLLTKVERKIVEPAVDAAGQPLAGRIRVRFVLPEHQQGQINLGLLYDRLLTPDAQQAAIPDVPGAQVSQRFLVIENIGRDEVVADGVQNLEPIGPGQQAYKDLQALLPSGRITQAYVVAAGANAPQLSFRLDTRARAAAAGATIGLARTWLTVDASGAYRGIVEFNIKNETEQYLEIQLPPSAQLWTAIVRFEPVKPVVPPNAQAGVVRIPLVKAALGEGDYKIVLKYGGHLGNLSQFSPVRFPLITTTSQSIQVEQSQVRLYLPRTHEWFNFGGTMKHAEDESELESGLQSYFYKQLEDTKRLLGAGSSDDYTRARAMNNLKQLEGAWSITKSQLSDQGRGEQATRNDMLLDEATELAGEQQAAQEQLHSDNNRAQLFNLWRGQQQERSKNVVGNLGSNFDNVEKALDPMQLEGKPGYNAEWFEKNKLQGGGKQPMRPDDPKKGESVDGKMSGSRVKLGKKSGGKEADEQAQQLKLNDYAEPKPGTAGEGQQQGQQPAQQSGVEDGLQQQNEQQNFRRYQQRLEQKQMQLDELQKSEEGRGMGKGRGQGERPEEEGEFNLQLQQRAFDSSRPQMGGFAAPAQPGMPPVSGPPPPGGGPAMTPPVAQSGAPADDMTAATGDIGGGGRADRFNVGGDAGATAAIAGLASMDVEIPADGVEHFFTTPRGKVEITARPVAQSLIARTWGIAGLAGVALVLWVLTRPSLVRVYRFALTTRTFAIVLILGGLLAILFGVLPLAGLIAMLAGGGLLVRRWAGGKVPAFAS